MKKPVSKKQIHQDVDSFEQVTIYKKTIDKQTKKCTIKLKVI